MPFVEIILHFSVFWFFIFLVNFSKFLKKLFIQKILLILHTAKVFTRIQFPG